MRFTVLPFLVVAILTARAENSYALELTDPGKFVLLGVGFNSCGTWTAIRRFPEAAEAIANE
jgi:hypothetical protein